MNRALITLVLVAWFPGWCADGALQKDPHHPAHDSVAPSESERVS